MWRHGRAQEDFSEEIRAHLEMETDRLRGEGLSEAEASAQARREFGNVTRVEERFYESNHIFLALEVACCDLRYALRTLAKNPGFATVAALVLALGIGSATALFTTVDRALLRAIPFPEPDRLVAGQKSINGVPSGPVSGPDYYDYRAQCKSFESLAALVSISVPGTITDGPEPELARVSFVTWDLFRTLGVTPAAGRPFAPDEAKGSDAARVMLSDGLASRLFGGARQAVGKTLHWNNHAYQIVGVMRRGFRFLIDADLWILMGRDIGDARDQHNYTLIGRLKPGVTLRQAQLEADGLSKVLEREYPASNTGKLLQLTGLHAYMVTDVRTSLLLLMAASVLVLLIACGNVAGLLLARGQLRIPEMAMRTALGAPRGRLVRQLLTESVLLTMFAGALGIGVAYALQGLLTRLLSLGQIEGQGPLLDGVALLFSLGASIATGILVGVVPALRMTALNLAHHLKTGSHSTEEAHSTRLRGSLVVLQVAVSAVLLIGSATLIHELAKLVSTDPGFAPDHVLTGRLQIQRGREATAVQRSAYFASLLQEIQGQPGVVSAAFVSLLPIEDPFNDWPIWPADQPRPANKDAVFAFARWVSSGYFDTMRIPLLRGRDIDASDIAGRRHVVILSKGATEKLFPNQNPIARTVHAGWNDTDYEVIGVVGDARLATLSDSPMPAFYLSAAQAGSAEMRVVVRTSGNPPDMISPLRRLLKRNDGSILFSEPVPMESILDKSLAGYRTIVLSAGVFSALALILTAVGLYGVLAYYVSQRRNEIAIRMALGATQGRILGMILGRGMVLVGAGLVLGAAGAYPELQLIRGMVVGVETLNLATCLSAAIVLCAASMLACFLPAWRATRGGLLAALREE